VKAKGLENLGILVRRKRGARGLRVVAKEVEISAATLMRVEEGRVPDLETFAKVCKWLGIDPGEVLGLKTAVQFEQPITAHFKVDRALQPGTAQALARMVMLIAQRQEPPPEQGPDVDT
jgi:transcriptional regulator with XRE-family HTH domain